MSRLKNEEVEQLASKGITETLDNLVLQEVIKQALKLKLKEDELITADLGVCPFSGKQRIMINHDDAEEKCMFCEKPVSTVVVIYQISNNQQLFCLESEVEEITSKAEQDSQTE